MPTYTTRLCSRERKPGDLILVQFEKPPGLQFRAGQFAELGLIESPILNLEETFRTFSFVSAPSDPSLEFTMRLSSSAFKTTLSTMSLGTKVLLKGPAGTLRLHSDENRPAMFLAGGVGIAPSVSILRQAAHDHLEHSFFMFYSTHSRSEMLYLEQLSALAASKMVNLQLILTLTGTAEPGWVGEKGRITASMIREHVSSAVNQMYYIAGPSRFVSGMISAATALDASEVDIRIEDFGDL